MSNTKYPFGRLLLVALLALSVSACKKDDNNTAELPDLLTIAKTQSNLEFFVAAAEYAGLDDDIATLEGITVFAPGNDAVSNYFEFSSPGDFEGQNVEDVRNFVNYHIINQSRTYAELSADVDASADDYATYETFFDYDFGGGVKTTEIIPVYALKNFSTGIVYMSEYQFIDKQGTGSQPVGKALNAGLSANDGLGKNGVLHIMDDYLNPNATFFKK